LGILGVEACAAVTWFSLPRSPYGDETPFFFSINPAILPPVGISSKSSAPLGFPAGRVWLSNTENGLLALSMYCTHIDHALFRWFPPNHRFECPVCGSKFTLAGRAIEGPAPRNLDRYTLHVKTPHGTVSTSEDGEPVNIEGANAIILDERKVIPG